jgi:outer membrane protein TolC
MTYLMLMTHGSPFQSAFPWRVLLTVCAVIGLLLGRGTPEALAEGTASIDDLEHRLAQTATLNDLVTVAYHQSPVIAAARQAWRAQVEHYRVATGLPDPQLMVTYFPEPIETRLGPQEWNATLSQTIPFPGKLIKAGEVVQTEARIAKLQLDITVRDVITRIRESVYELMYVRAAKGIAAQQAKLLNQLQTVGETAYAEDRAALVDRMKALSQSGQLRYDALLLDELERVEITRLNSLLNRTPQAVIGDLVVPPLPPLPYSLEAITQLAESHQEEIRIAEQGIHRAEAQMGLARSSYFPDFKVGLFYARIGHPDVPQPPPNAGDDAFGIQFGLTLPLWFGKNQGRLHQARADRAKAEAGRQSRINEARAQLHATYFRLQNARRLVELYQNELLPQAAQTLQIAETWFQKGQSSFADVVEAQAVWYHFQLALARAQADYGKHWVGLEQLVGHALTEKERQPAGSREGKHP